MAKLMTPGDSVSPIPRQRHGSSSHGLTPAQHERAQQVEAVRRQFAQLEQWHRAEFGGPTREPVTRPALPKFAKLLATAEKQALKGVGLLDRSSRKSARAIARETAEHWAHDLMALADAERNRRQDDADRRWAGLHAGDPAIVVAVLSDAFAAGQRPVRVVAVVDAVAGLRVTTTGASAVPDTKPAVTPSGVPTLHRLNKTDRAVWQRQVVASQMLLAAKEAIALAPGLAAARVIAVDGAGIPVVAACLTRVALSQADWRADAWQILTRMDPSARFHARARTGELLTIDLRSDEAFRPLIGAS